LPTDEEQTSNSNSSQGPTSPLTPTFTLNKQAGLVNVYASEHAQKEVEEYLKLVRRAVTAQVLIEAKILVVTLNDEHSMGIDWRAMTLGDLTLNFFGEGFGVLETQGPDVSPVADQIVEPTQGSFVIGAGGNDFQALIKAINGFGTVRALASPRLTVLNNQSAVLNVANNRVFFEIDVDVTTEEGVSQVDIDSDIRNVPEGVLVNVQPSINLDQGTISMSIRPTITRIVDTKADPAVQFVTASAGIEGVESLVPELNVQEIDSVIQVNSGQPVIMGGLLQDRIAGNQSGVPVLGEIPVAGALFRDHYDLVQKTELVIFLKATILPSPGDSVHTTDRDVYRMFSGDRRPFKL
jgi:MSHA biogenesis protein MshL